MGVDLGDEGLVEGGECMQELLGVEFGSVVEFVADLGSQQLHLTDAENQVETGGESLGELGQN